MSLLGDSLHETFNDLNSVNCPTCLRTYSVAEELRPHILACGHSVCKSCLQNHRACGTCNQEYEPGEQPLNYNLSDIIEEMSKMIDGVCEFKAQCSRCSSWEPMEKARICKTCSKTCALDGNDDITEEEKMAPFVFCPSCAIDEHIEKDHDVSKYLPWKNRVLMNTSSEAARNNVTSIVDLCVSEWENGRKQLYEWKQAVSLAVETGNALSTVMRCKHLAGNCDRHANTIYEALDGTLLPTLRAFSQTVKMATDDLKSDTTCAMHEEQGEQKVEEPTKDTGTPNSEPFEEIAATEPNADVEDDRVDVEVEEPVKEEDTKSAEVEVQEQDAHVTPAPVQASA